MPPRTFCGLVTVPQYRHTVGFCCADIQSDLAHLAIKQLLLQFRLPDTSGQHMLLQAQSAAAEQHCWME